MSVPDTFEHPEVPFSQIAYAVEDRIATITLSRPDRLNAFTHIMRRELVDTLDLADADDDVRAVIVTGAGRGFCAGADLGAVGDRPFSYSGPDHRDSHSDPDHVDGLPRDIGGMVALRVAAMRKPMIAAINGAAIGVGITMTLPMDIRLIDQSAKVGFVFARRGIAPEATSSWFLPRVVGISQALEWSLSGRIFDADEAHRGGLVSRVCAPGTVYEQAVAVAREIADTTSAASVAATRRMMWAMTSQLDPWEAHRLETRIIADLKQGTDAREGVQSFLEKRPAHFTATIDEVMSAALPTWPDRPSDTG